MDGIKATVTGIPDLKEALRSIVPKLRVRALRNALAAGARIVQKAARAAAPIISSSSLAVRKGYRKPGTLRQAISVRTSKVARAAGDVGVFVNVRPKRGALGPKTMRIQIYKQRGRLVSRGQMRASSRYNPDDPFYWRWLEFGWNPSDGNNSLAAKRARRKVAGARTRNGFKFLQKGASKLPEALAAFVAKIGPAIEKLNRPKAPAP